MDSFEVVVPLVRFSRVLAGITGSSGPGEGERFSRAHRILAVLPAPPNLGRSGAPRRDFYSPLLPMKLIRSRTRQEYPHSLSYQEITLTQLPPTTRVISESTMEERESPRKSTDTNSSSVNPR